MPDDRYVYPRREHAGRSGRRDRATTSGIEWLPPESVPGAVMSAQAQQDLQRKLDEITRCQAWGRASARNYLSEFPSCTMSGPGDACNAPGPWVTT